MATEDMGTEDQAKSAAVDGEFADYAGGTPELSVEFRWTRLLNPPAIRAISAVVAGLILISSERSTRTVAIIVGLVLIIVAVTELIGNRTPEQRFARIARAATQAALGVALVVWPNVSGNVIARLIAVALALAGARDVLRAVRSDRDVGHTVWWFIRGFFTLALGAAMWISPDSMLTLVLAAVAIFWIATGLATIVGNLSTADQPVGVTDVWPRFFEWLDKRPHSADDRSQLYEKLFFEGFSAARRLSRFFILMGFATTIATFGVITNSTAVVIGAMLIAPLMTPLMGTSLSLVMGWPSRAARSGLVAAGGIVLAIGLAALFGIMLPFGLDPVTNSQVASRIAPNLYDLAIAIAAGGAGAFALSRPDVSDALPGVAVAIALVPPLAVVGLMFVAGDGGAAFGALLLFGTNLVAILLVGAIVFLLTGVVPIRTLVARRDWIRNSATLIGILAIAIIVLLGSANERIRAAAFDQDDVERAVTSWIGASDLEALSVDVSTSEVQVVVVGSDRPPDPNQLSQAINSELGRAVKLTLKWVPEQTFVVDSADK